jgi:hypothetical protein
MFPLLSFLSLFLLMVKWKLLLVSYVYAFAALPTIIYTQCAP